MAEMCLQKNWNTKRNMRCWNRGLHTTRGLCVYTLLVRVGRGRGRDQGHLKGPWKLRNWQMESMKHGKSALNEEEEHRKAWETFGTWKQNNEQSVLGQCSRRETGEYARKLNWGFSTRNVYYQTKVELGLFSTGNRGFYRLVIRSQTQKDKYYIRSLISGS